MNTYKITKFCKNVIDIVLRSAILRNVKEIF